jgi:phosphoribosylaminoimidazole-succinocarboxamide synthase
MSARGLVQGQVLNLTSAWWMRKTQHIVANALEAVPDPNVAIMHSCSVFPVEFVVRGFLTGAWTAVPYTVNTLSYPHVVSVIISPFALQRLLM